MALYVAVGTTTAGADFTLAVGEKATLSLTGPATLSNLSDCAASLRIKDSLGRYQRVIHLTGSNPQVVLEAPGTYAAQVIAGNCGIDKV